MKDLLIGMVMPPKEGASEQQLYVWRMTVGVVILLLCFATVNHMMWSVGYGPYSGEGFVQRGEFKKLADDNRAARKNSLRVTIVETKRESCRATGPYKVMLGEQLTELRIEWADLTGKEFPLPKCDELT